MSIDQVDKGLDGLLGFSSFLHAPGQRYLSTVPKQMRGGPRVINNGSEGLHGL